MADWIIEQTVEMTRPTQPYTSRPVELMLPGDHLAHTWRIKCLERGLPADLTGFTASGYFKRMDGNYVLITGSISSNTVSVTLTQECYAYPGSLRGVVRIANADTDAVVTLADRLFFVQSAVDDGGTVDPGEVIPSLADLLAEIDAMETATAAAEAAATKAVRYDSAQSLTDAQKEQARSNIDAASDDDVDDLKSAVSNISGQYKTISQYTVVNGMINSQGKWANINSSYQHIVISVTAGDVVSITGNASNNTYIAFLQSYTTPVNNVSADFSAETGFTSRIQLNKGAEYSYTVPSDTNYLYILVNNNGYDTTPKAFFANGRDYSLVMGDALIEVIGDSAEQNQRLEAVEEKIVGYDYKELQSYNVAYGSITAQGKWSNMSSAYTHIAIPVSAGDYAIIKGNADYNSLIAFVRSYSVPSNNDNVDFSQTTGFTDRIQLDKGGYYKCAVPSDAHYLIVHINIGGNDSTPANIQINFIDIKKGITDNIVLVGEPKVVNWCAMGDSITNGYYSYDDGGTPTAGTAERLKTWSYRVAQYNRWRMTNIAVGGSGYLHEGGGSRGYLLARSTDFTPYNLVTIAYGINDWKGNNAIGEITDDPTEETQTTVIGAMKATIEAIMSSNPACKIIIILPLNCRGYEYNYGDESTNYGLGYRFTNSGTLNEFSEALISVCNYYGIQYVDMTHYSCINRKNLPDMLPDGVHPSLDCHALLAAELSKKITF